VGYLVDKNVEYLRLWKWMSESYRQVLMVADYHEFYFEQQNNNKKSGIKRVRFRKRPFLTFLLSCWLSVELFPFLCGSFPFCFLLLYGVSLSDAEAGEDGVEYGVG
jgi:hypothetical protein